jgi:glycosyltransferase involved in cell wall biosynthesis
VWISTGLVGGAELCLAESAAALTERGHEVHIAVPGNNRLLATFSGVASVHICPHNAWMATGLPLRDKARWSAYNLKVASRDLARLVRLVNADVVVSNSLMTVAGALSAQRAGRPHAWYLRELSDGNYSHSLFLGDRATFALMRRWADVFVVEAERTRQFYTQRLRGADVRIVPPDVRVHGVHEVSHSGGPLRLVLVGAKHPSKGQQDAVEAMALLVGAGLDVELDLVGGGEAFEEQLRRDAIASGLASRVHFVPRVDDPWNYVARADIALTCSRYEGFSRSTVEAMKAGLPVIGTPVGVIPELLRDEWNGYVYEPGDVEQLARHVRTLYDDREQIAVMGGRGRKLAWERFNSERHGLALEDVLTSIARKP